MKKKKKYSIGGQLLQTGVSFIPGVGQILAPLVGLANQQANQAQMLLEEQKLLNNAPKTNANIYGQFATGGSIAPLAPTAYGKKKYKKRGFNPLPLMMIAGGAGLAISDGLPQKAAATIPQTGLKLPESPIPRQNTDWTVVDMPNNNLMPLSRPFANMAKYGGKLKAKGGVLNDGFKQYDTGSHSTGNDLAVDSNGIPNPNADNYVQNKENSFQVDGKQYVFSDTLGGKTKFNKQAMKINNKYPKARLQLDQRNALDFEMKQLSKENDIARIKTEAKQTQFAYGGPLLNKAIRQASNLWNNQSVPLAEGNMFVNPENQVDMREDTQPVINGIPTPPTNMLPKLPETGILSPEQIAGRDAEASYQFSTNPLDPKTQNRNFAPLSAKGANAIGLGLKGLALAGSIRDANMPAEKENLITPNYRRADEYMKSANIDYTQAKQDSIGVSNIGGNMNRSLSGNAAQFQGREQARLAQLQDTLGRINMQEGNARSQLNLTKGQYEANKAVDNANRTYQNQQGNMQNEANSRYADRILSSDLASIGSSFNQFAETSKVIQNNKEVNDFQVKQQIALLNSRYPNIKVTPEIMEKLKAGASIDEIIKISI